MVNDQQQTLVEAIFRISRGDLAQMQPAVPKTSELIRDFRFFRIRVLSVPNEAVERELALSERCRQLLGSSHAQQQALRILLTRKHGENCLSIGLPVGHKSVSEQKVELESIFRGDQVISLDNSDVRAGFSGLPSAVSLVGVPGCIEQVRDAESHSTTHLPQRSLLDRLNQYTGSESFACMIMTAPLAEASARAYHHGLADEHSQSAIQTRLVGTVDEQDRLAKHYAGLLDELLASAQRGLSTGLWQCMTIVSASSNSICESIVGLGLGSINFGNDHPVPLRPIMCHSGGHDSLPSQYLNSEELASLIGLPRQECPGYRFRNRTMFTVDPIGSSSSSSINLGAILDRSVPTGFDLKIPVNSLASHTLVSGLTGSGKTTTVLHILDQLWTKHQIPFLVIESAKREYRQLLGRKGFDDLRVFTLGDETVAPLRLNPFEILPGFPPQVHIDLLKTLFRAAFVLYPPMPEVLELALTEIYQDRGWDLTKSSHSDPTSSPRRFPTLDDLYEKTGEVVDRLGYEDRLQMDIRASLRVRLDSLRLNSGKGCMLNVQTSTPLTQLVDTPCILELQGLASDDEKAFLIGLVLIRLYEHFDLKTRRKPGSFGLSLVTVVEEAHRLLRRAPEGQGEVSANPRGEAIQTFGNMLAEFRAHGCGLMISEQIPSKLISDTIKNTGMKITHKIMAQDDRELLGGAMGCNDEQTKGFLDLACGEAVVRFGDLHGPVLVKVPYSLTGLHPVDNDFVRSIWKQATAAAHNSVDNKILTSAMEQLMAEPSFLRLVERLLIFLSAGVPEFTEVLKQLEGRICSIPSFLSQKTGLVETILSRSLERQLERRARFYGWSLATTDGLVSDSSNLAHQFSFRGQQTPGMGHAAVLNGGRRLGESLTKVLELESGPHNGCVICDKRCRFRYEVAEAMDQQMRSETARAISSGNGPAVKDEIQRKVWEMLGDQNDTVALDLATCFAVSLPQSLVEGHREGALAKVLNVLLREEF